MSLSATNSPTQWTITSGPNPVGGGSMPAGSQLTLSPVGVLSWLVPVTGNYQFTVVATNQFGNSTPTVFTLSIITPSISDVFPQDNSQVASPEIYLIVGTKHSTLVQNFLPYTFTGNGDQPLTWSQQPPTGGVLAGETAGVPTGTSFNVATGVLDGTPTTAGRFKFNLRLSNIPANAHANETFWINVVSRPQIITQSLLSGNVNAPYPSQAQNLQASGTTPITYQVLPADVGETGLPPGLSLSGSNISGTPTTQGTYTFTIRAQNIAGASYVDDRQFTIFIGPSGAPIITGITGVSGTIMNGIRGTVLGTSGNGFTLTATGNATIVWALDSGNFLPPGISLNPNTGIISGTPGAGGTYNFVIVASNAQGNDSRMFTLMIGDPPEITTPSLPDGLVNEEYGPETITVTGDSLSNLLLFGGDLLPPGLVLNWTPGQNTATIDGTPTTAGIYNFRIRAINASGNDTVTYTITIASSGGTWANGEEAGRIWINSLMTGNGTKEIGAAWRNSKRVF